MKEKIAQLMKNESLSSSRFAEILEIQPSAVSHYLSGRNKPGFDLMQKILRRFPKINPDWLLLDSPQIYRDENSPTSGVSSAEGVGSPIDLFGDNAALFGSIGGDVSSDVIASNGGGSSLFRGADFPLNIDENFEPKNSQNGGVNFAQNLSQNSPQNRAQNQVQNQGQNSPISQVPQGARMTGARVGVERIIVLYSDGTCRTYEMR